MLEVNVQCEIRTTLSILHMQDEFKYDSDLKLVTQTLDRPVVAPAGCVSTHEDGSVFNVHFWID